MPEELSPSQAAARIGATTRSVQRWIAAGVLPARRVGGRWRVASDAIDAFVGEAASGALDRTADRAAPPTIGAVFIANRGEIAARIARTCMRLGIRAVIPPVEGPAAIDLLDIGAVVSAAQAAGAHAIHPGFGFLAENAEFAEAVEAAGIRWIGPPPAAIRAMGDKAAARRLAGSLGVPVVPGYDGADQSDDGLAAAARKVGLPLLVKPAAGGGGKGMRAIRDFDGLADAVASARREAAAAFGDDRLILERLVEGPRHVEIQVLFDGRGSGVQLGERDCSIQRRHQKILEEAPSPGLDPKVRQRMGKAALRLAGAVGYVGAGTCEFLVEDRGTFRFLEMNTRLQVEHPVTEAITGRDLVADQIRIAGGEPLGIGQAGVDSARTAGGHAIEVRLYAEDAEAGFLPSTGRVEALNWPSGTGVRVDSGIEVGTTVTGRFDPMLAKIIAHGATRAEALDRLRSALDETEVLGLTTNLRFLRWLVREPAVADGQARIDTLDRIWPPDDWPARTAIPEEAWSTAAWLLVDAARAGLWSGGWRLNGPASIRVAADDEVRTVRLAAPPSPAPAFRVARGVDEAGDMVVHLDLAGRSAAFRLAPPPDVDRAARAASAHGQTGGSVDVVAPMPGGVLAVHVAPGDDVEAGQPVATLEAMKMEHVVAAPMAGRVADVLVRPADQVVRGQPLATVAP